MSVSGSGVASVKPTHILLAHSAVASSITGTTVTTTLATVKVPAGAMGPNGLLRITSLWSWTNNANAKTAQVKFAGVSTMGGSGANSATMEIIKHIRNRNSQASQLVNDTAVIGTPNAATAATIAVDTSVDQNITFDVTLGVGTDTATLESYTVELIRP